MAYRLVSSRCGGRDLTLDFKIAAKSISCVDLRDRRKNHSVKIFKGMQGVCGWIGPFDILFPIFVPASFVLYNLPFAWRSRFEVSGSECSECSECSVVLPFRINEVFSLCPVGLK